MVDEGLVGPVGVLPAEEGRRVAALLAPAARKPEQAEDRLLEVDHRDNAPDDGARCNHGGPAQEQRHAVRGLVHHVFPVKAVLAHVVAVVGREDDERIVQDAAFAHRVENAADVVVDAPDHAAVGGFAFAQRPLAVRLVPTGPGGDGGRLDPRGMVPVPERRWDGHLGGVEHAGVRLADGVGLVRVRDAEDEEERAVVHGAANEVDGAVGEPVGRVRAGANLLAPVEGAVAFLEDGLGVSAVLHEAAVFEAHRPLGRNPVVGRFVVSVEVPLPDVGGLVAVPGKDVGEGDFVAMDGHGVAVGAVAVRVAAGEHAAAGRGADGAGGEEVRAGRAIAGEGVDVGRRDERAAVCAQRPGILLVGEDDEDVGRFLHSAPFRCGRRGGSVQP